MLKMTSVFLFVVMFITSTMHGQTLSILPKDNQDDLQQIFIKETQKLKNESSAVNTKEINKIRKQAPRKGWSKTKTALVVLAVIGIAALVFVTIKYYKKCIRYEPRGCSFSDDNCYCAEYEEDEEEARRLK